MVGRQQSKNDDQQSKWMGVSGGQFEPLTYENIDEIHEAVIDLLETLGLSQAPQCMIDIVTARGSTFTSSHLAQSP